MNIWEIGVLLAGIGFLILCIFAAVSLRDFGVLARRMERMIEESEEDIRSISQAVAGISENVEIVSARVEKVVTLVTTFEQLKALFKKNKTDEEDILEEDIDIEEDINIEDGN